MSDIAIPSKDASDPIIPELTELLSLDMLQKTQDAFAKATGVASIITHPNGIPITARSSFCGLCNIIRNTDKGQADCFLSDSIIGRHNPSGPIIQPCLGGLWLGGASITVGGRHIANWLIGQVRNNDLDMDQIISYSKEIGVEESVFKEALYEVPIMSKEQFSKVADALFQIANQLSSLALLNYQQAKQSEYLEGLVEERTRELRESETQYRQLSEAAFDGIVIAENGKVLECNEAFAKMYGYTPDEIIGKEAKHLVAPAYLDTVMEKIATGYQGVYEIEGLRKDGSTFPHETHGVTVPYQGRQVRLTAVRDITERKRMEEMGKRQMLMMANAVTECKQTEESLKLTQFAVDNSNDAVLWIAKDAHFTKVNEKACKKLGYTSEELLNMTVHEIDPDFPPEVWEKHWEEVKEKKSFTVETRHKRKDGSIFPVEVLINYVQTDYGEYSCTFVRDITERKKIEKDLRESEERYRDLVETSQDIIWRCDKEGRFTYLNPAWEKTHGYKIEEMLGHKFTEFQAPEAAEKEGEILESHINDERSFVYETSDISKTGQTIHLRFHAMSVKDEDGNVVGAQGTAHDITESKKVEETIRESEERFRRTFESAVIGTITAGKDGRFLEVNRSFCLMLGYTGEELLTLSFKDITHPDDLHSDDQLVRQLLDGKISQFQVEKRYMNKKGHIVWGLLSVSLVRDANEIPLYFIDQLQDITLRKQAEEKLRKVEQNIRAIITTVGEGVVVVDSDSRIRFVNEELLNIFGYSEKELIGETIQTLMPKDRRASHASGMKKHLNGAPPKILGRRVELKGLHKDGSTFPIELRIEETKEDSGVRFFTGAIRDITERKQAEEELRNSKEEAEEATKLKDKYVSLVAHDLKSPLGTLVSILELIKSRRDPGLSGNTGKAFMLATSNAKNMMNLINDVLDVGRFKSGQIKLNRTFIDCIYSTTKVAMIFDEMAKEKGIKLVNEVAPETMLYADPVLFEEVIKNLLSNAIKFCREGDQITIYTPEGNKTAIAVKDTGPGIQKNILPDVFKEEVKTSTKGTAGETGTGLGLPYSKDIMEAHGGNLTVESEEGKGTEFIASLPYVDPENSDADNQ